MNPPPPSLRERLERHLERRRSLNLSPRTLRTVHNNVIIFLVWLARTHQVQEAERLRPEHLDDWIGHLSAYRTTKDRPLRPRSVNKMIECVRGFLQALAAEGTMAAQLPERLVHVKEPQFLPGSVLTDEQVRKLIAAIDTGTPEGYRDRVMLEVLYSSGVRSGELLGMNVQDVDLAEATARVTGKGRKERMVPLGRTAVRLIETYLLTVRPALMRRPEEARLFLDDLGAPYPYHTLRRRLQEYARRAELPVPVTPHTFRRSCATEMLRAGANMYHIKEMLGHESLDTLRHYARLTILDLKKTHHRCHPREQAEGATEEAI